MELWDVYDKDRRPLGKTHPRGERMKEGEYHVGVSIWTVNEKGEILITLRDPQKESYPGYWENTGGSLLAGEDSLAGAVRELYEETGIEVKKEELHYLGSVRGVDILMDIYGLKKHVELSDIVFQKGETVDARLVSFAEFERMCRSGEIAPPIGKRFQELYIPLREFAEA